LDSFGEGVGGNMITDKINSVKNMKMVARGNKFLAPSRQKSISSPSSFCDIWGFGKNVQEPQQEKSMHINSSQA
jgi:hypothetical protein